jgi:hypothetical protein
VSGQCLLSSEVEKRAGRLKLAEICLADEGAIGASSKTQQAANLVLGDAEGGQSPDEVFLKGRVDVTVKVVGVGR